MLMILHYLTVAVRSLMKYKVQTAVCMVGLAVGFACFAFSMIWIRYELTYDDFHRGADRLYTIYQRSGNDLSRISSTDAYPLAAAVREAFPEVEDAAAFLRWASDVKWEGQTCQMSQLQIDSSFVRMFDVRLLQGSWDFLHSSEGIALTEEGARRIFGTTDVLGREVEVGSNKMKVVAVVSGWSRHSNFFYEMLTGVSGKDAGWSNLSYTSCIRLREGTDAHSFARKLETHEFRQGEETIRKHWQIEPITRCRYTIYQDTGSVSLRYVRLFSVVGGFIILLALVNYFSILVTRIRIRARELALRTVCGSSRTGLLSLFMSELVVLLLASGLLGMTLTELSASAFRELSHVETGVMFRAFLYYLFVLAVSLLLTFCVVWHYSRKSLADVMNGCRHAGHVRVNFQQVSVWLQLFMSVLILFCLSVLMKQLYHLSHIDIGFERDGRATLIVHAPERKKLIDDIRRLPYVQEVQENMYSLLPRTCSVSIGVNEWEGKQPDDRPVTLQVITQEEDFIRFYGIRILQGSGKLDTPKDIIINETAAKAFGWAHPLGKKMGMFTVTGVMKDLHLSAPTVPAQPMRISKPFYSSELDGNNILIRFDEAHSKELKQFCEQKMNEYAPGVFCRLQTVNEVYDRYLVSERALMYLLSFISVVCVVISLFGVYSHVTLDCARRQKEIAIRKVNGATAGNIIRFFLYQYGVLLVLACLVAFPIGTLVMSRWLEHYVERTSLSWWLYAVIGILLYIFILICIGWRVWQAANKNPAEVVKRE